MSDGSGEAGLAAGYKVLRPGELRSYLSAEMCALLETEEPGLPTQSVPCWLCLYDLDVVCCSFFPDKLSPFTKVAGCSCPSGGTRVSKIFEDGCRVSVWFPPAVGSGRVSCGPPATITSDVTSISRLAS